MARIHRLRAKDSEDASQAHADAAPRAGQSRSTVCPGVIPRQKARPTPEVQGPKQTSVPASSSDLPNFGGGDVAPPLGSPRESKSNKITNMQNLKNQVLQFLEYSEPRPSDDAHFVKAEGAIVWVKGISPCEGTAKSFKVSEQLSTMLQRNEDTDRNYFGYGGTSQYLQERETPYLTASFMMPGVIRSCHFLGEAYHRFGSYGYRDCAFLHDEMYHIGTRLSIWLRHEGADTRPRLIEAEGFQWMTSSMKTNSGRMSTSN